MPMSTYMRRLRECWGESRLLVPSVAGVVRDGRNRVLLVRPRETGEWSTPGGAIELEDTPADAVVREVWEETGLVVRPARLFAVYGGPNFIVRYSNGDETQRHVRVRHRTLLRTPNDQRARPAPTSLRAHQLG